MSPTSPVMRAEGRFDPVVPRPGSVIKVGTAA
jgi:hypothetical protein